MYAINGGYQSGITGPLQITSPGVTAPPPVTPPTTEAARNLLFFGNSFTIYNSVPTLVAEIATADGHLTPSVHMEAFNNWTLGDHLNQQNIDGAAIINTSLAPGASWNDVVFQEFSTRPTTIGSPAAFRSDAAGLFARVRSQSHGVHAILEETWARGADNALYPGSFSGPVAMQDQLQSNYGLAAQDLNNSIGAGTAEVAPVGEVWRASNWVRALYDGSDEYHPSARGSLLAALTLYSTIYHDGTADIPAAKVAATLSRLGLNAADWQAATALADTTNRPAITTP